MPVDAVQLFTVGSEREALELNLDAQREGLMRKIEGLDDAAARQAPTASSLSLLGLLKHAATWERRWFQVVMAGGESPDGWPAVRPSPPDAYLIVDETDTVGHWLASYRELIERSRPVTASMSVASPCARPDLIECNLRYVLFRMIQETARHAGHADIIPRDPRRHPRNLRLATHAHAASSAGEWTGRAGVVVEGSAAAGG